MSTSSPARPGATAPLVGILMGSESDHETMKRAEEMLRRFDVPYEIAVVSAHRTPDRMFAWAKGAAARGLQVLICGAGGAAHLPGMVSALTLLPVLGVPVESKTLRGMDSLLSIVQMPAGIPTATFAIGGAGAANAALFAIRMLALHDPTLASRLVDFQADSERTVLASDARVRGETT